MRRASELRWLVLGLLALLASGCVHARDFRAPGERLTPRTAYAEHARVRVDVDLLAPQPSRLVANLGLTVAAVRDHLDFTVNLAHGAIGVVNVKSQFTVFESRWYALGGRAALTYLNPRTFYFLPRDLRRSLGGFNLISSPIELWQSFPITGWFAAHLGMGYRATGVWGDFDGEGLLVDANLAQRAFAFEPVLDFYIAKRVALRAHARLPAFAQIVAANDVQAELEPGVVVGVRSVEWIDRPFARTATLDFAAETRFGANTHLRLGVSVWAFRPIEALTVMPSVGLYWRFR